MTTSPGTKAANCEHEYEQSGERVTPPAAYDHYEAACPIDADYLRARDIEAIVMCGLYVDPVARPTGPKAGSDRSTIVERCIAIVKRLLDFGR
jgi:hypothetical protein